MKKNAQGKKRGGRKPLRYSMGVGYNGWIVFDNQTGEKIGNGLALNCQSAQRILHVLETGKLHIA